MKKLFVVMTAFILFVGCEGLTDNDGENADLPKVIRIGETFTDKQISVKAASVRLVDDEIIVIDITITNNRSDAIKYSNIFSWGELKTPSNTQLETSIYFHKEIPSFTGSKILSVVTVQDTISFDKYTPVEGEYVFYANPPLPGDFTFLPDDLTSEKMSDFQIKFDYREIEK
jgi:hypothetical protein